MGFRIQVHNNQVIGIWVIVIVVQILRKAMTIGYLDPEGRVQELEFGV